MIICSWFNVDSPSNDFGDFSCFEGLCMALCKRFFTSFGESWDLRSIWIYLPAFFCLAYCIEANSCLFLNSKLMIGCSSLVARTIAFAVFYRGLGDPSVLSKILFVQLSSIRWINDWIVSSSLSVCCYRHWPPVRFDLRIMSTPSRKASLSVKKIVRFEFCPPRITFLMDEG